MDTHVISCGSDRAIWPSPLKTISIPTCPPPRQPARPADVRQRLEAALWKSIRLPMRAGEELFRVELTLPAEKP